MKKSQSTIHLTVDTKAEAKELARSEGLTLSVYIDQLLKREIRKAARAK